MIFLVPYAYDRMPDGKAREGVPANRLGSKARCDALIDKLKTIDLQGETYDFLLTAGYDKKQRIEPNDKRELRIANQMAKYIRSFNLKVFTGSVRTWGTFEETQEAINEIKDQTFGPESVKIYTSTNLGHLPRVWLCWFFLKPQGWKIHFILAKHSFTPKEYRQETIKFFVYLYCFLFKKW